MAGCWLALATLGCSKEDFTELVDKAKNAATEGSSQVAENVEAAKQKMASASAGVQEQLNLAGRIELSVGEPARTDACYVNFVPQGSGRPTILQLQSYRSAAQESFPSIFLQAQTNAESLTELVGKTLPARLFVQPQQGGPVLFSQDAEPVALKIVSVDDKTLAAELVSGSLLNTASGTSIAATGTFTGTLPQ